MLHVWEFGPAHGRPIVALHGLKGYGGRWRQVASLLEPGFRVSAPDMRGHGRSSYAGPWTLESHAADVLDLPVFGDGRPVDIVAQSFGGAVAMMMASVAPQRIRRMVLLEPSVGVPANVAAANGVAERQPPVFDDVALATEARVRNWPEAARGQVDTEIREHLRQDPDGRWRWRYAPEMAEATHAELVRRIAMPATIPVLVVRALGGAIPARQVDEWRVSGATVIDMGCGHQVYFERPAETAAAISDCLRL